MDPKDLEAIKRKFPVSKAVADRNLYESIQHYEKVVDRLEKRRIRQDRSKPNKLEERWIQYLQSSYPGEGFITQSLRFRLGNGIWYKPDAFCWNHEWPEGEAPFVRWRPTAWEVKGPKSWRGGFENLKVAASLYPDVRWVLVWDDCGWNEQEVLP
jgi:hypothetical protein